MRAVPDPVVVEVLSEHYPRDNHDEEGEYVGYICKCRAAESGPFDTDHMAHLASLLEPLFRARESRAWTGGWLAGFADHERQFGTPKTTNPYEGNQP